MCKLCSACEVTAYCTSKPHLCLEDDTTLVLELSLKGWVQ